MNNKRLLEMLNESFNSNNVAVIEKTQNWSYAELKQYSLFARDCFIAHNTKRVLLCLPQGFTAYCIILGAYLANTVYCPVNPKNPEDRVLYFAEVFKPDLVISESLSVENTDSTNFVNSADFFVGVEDFTPNMATSQSSDGLAYVMFTSGSTGLPKGVQISRHALENFLIYTVKAWGIDSCDVFGQYSNLGFDLSMADIFVAVLCGAALVPISTESEKLLPGKMIEKHGITFWHSVPSVVDLLAKANALKPSVLSSLKKVSFCGEKLFKSQLDSLFKANNDLIVYNTYGPTEATIFCSLIELTSASYSDCSDNTISIGIQVDGMKLLLENIDNDGLGELIISGANVSDGYLSGDVDSQSVFFKSNVDGEFASCYRTGDYVYSKNGLLFFHGRRDSQIKRMGNRIDLSEIDHCVRTFTSRVSSTIVHNDKIITFVERSDFTENDVYEMLRSKLPDYYIPQRIAILEKLPRNNSGKIDNRALREVQNESYI
jgi:D-alanine--poly(phosphoribitol) ligase subunit 1